MVALGWQEQVLLLSHYPGSYQILFFLFIFFILHTCYCRIKALTTGRISSFADVVSISNLLERDGYIKILVHFFWLDRNLSVSYFHLEERKNKCMPL